MIDLHTHSTLSDGLLTPTQLVELARRQKITALALTDHDTILGLQEASLACMSQGMMFIPGIELQVEWGDGEFHLLGLDLKSPERLNSALVDVQEWRNQRNWKIFEKMKNAGVLENYVDMKTLAGTGQIGRLHLARFLVKQGKAKTLKEAFTKWLSKEGLFYEKKRGLELAVAIDLIHQAGGLAVLAHPMSLRLSLMNLEDHLVRWQAVGLDALEAWHPGASPTQCHRLELLAKKIGLKWSAGSDFHAEQNSDRRLGFTAGGQPIHEEILQALFEERNLSLPITKQSL